MKYEFIIYNRETFWCLGYIGCADPIFFYRAFKMTIYIIHHNQHDTHSV